MKLRKVIEEDLVKGNVLYNKNGTPRTICKKYVFDIEFGTGASYKIEEIVDNEDWKIQCHKDEFLEKIEMLMDHEVIYSYTVTIASFRKYIEVSVKSKLFDGDKLYREPYFRAILDSGEFADMVLLKLEKDENEKARRLNPYFL